MQDDRGIPVRDRVEWISFEARMLRRRFARCLLRADLALEDGFCDDARSAIEEARAIFPSSAEIPAFEARLAELEARAAAPQPDSPAPQPLPPAAAPIDVPLTPAAAESAQSARPRWRRGAAAAAASVLALLGTATAWQIGSTWPHTVPATQVNSTVGVAGPAQQTPAPQASKTLPRNLEIVRDTIVVPAPPRPRDEIGTPGPYISARGPEASPAPESPTGLPPPAASDSYPAIPAPEPRNDRSDVVAALNVRAPEPEPLPERLPRSGIEPGPGLVPPSAPAPPASSPVDAPAARTEHGTPTLARAEDLAIVRSVLERYEGAYSALDADAASEIWPTVNRGALARAFHGLATQHVSLGTCDVTLKGPAARATCQGTASWKPKVGGGLRTEDRRWEFELRKDGAAWIIERASAR
jgi:hypothetical protein